MKQFRYLVNHKALMMDRSFLTDIKQEMPPYAARIYSAMVADGSQEIYERFFWFCCRLLWLLYVLSVSSSPGAASDFTDLVLFQKSKKHEFRVI